MLFWSAFRFIAIIPKIYMEWSKFIVTTMEAILSRVLFRSNYHTICYISGGSLEIFCAIFLNILFWLSKITFFFVTYNGGLYCLNGCFDSNHVNISLLVSIFQFVYNLHLSNFLGLFFTNAHNSILNHTFKSLNLTIILDFFCSLHWLLFPSLILFFQIFLL